MSYKPIGDYGIIGNMLSAALVGRDGSIDWCCLPRFDSPSVFAAILDDEKGGRFYIKPQAKFQSCQAYMPDTNVLQTTFQTEEGADFIRYRGKVMSIGIGGKLFGKGFEFYVGKHTYSHSLKLATISILKLDEGFSLLTAEVAFRW